MQAPDIRAQQFEFVKQLTLDLASGDIRLPSFPDVVIKIRDLLEDEDCEIGKLSDVVGTDAVLTSKLFVYANSSQHNRSGDAITTLDAAISRLGLKLVRSTALSLAVKQIVLAEEHSSIASDLKRIWESSLRLAAWCYAVAALAQKVDPETAYLCGLLHQIGKSYILMKAKHYPDFLGDAGSLKEIQKDWHSQVGYSIVESWGFPEEVCHSLNPEDYFDEHTHLDPAPVDIVYAARDLLEVGTLEDSAFKGSAVWQKLKLDSQDVSSITEVFNTKLTAAHTSLN